MAKARTKTLLRRSSSKLTYGKEQAEHFSVTVAPEFADLTPSGTVKVKLSARTLCSVHVRHGKGTCTLGAKALPAGKYSVTVFYPGSANVTGSRSTKSTFTVKSPKVATTRQ